MPNPPWRPEPGDEDPIDFTPPTWGDFLAWLERVRRSVLARWGLTGCFGCGVLLFAAFAAVGGAVVWWVWRE